MTSEEQKEYRALVRGAATYVLLGSKDPPVETLEVARLYKLDPAVVNADIDIIVQSGRQSRRGVRRDDAWQVRLETSN